jgi:hypothetical protein
MKNLTSAALAASMLFATSAALADPYVEYTPQKGVWQITAMEVDPNHVDEYLVGLSKSQVPGFEILRRRGLIDDYKFVVRNGYVKGSPNVLIMTHTPSMALLDANKARDLSVQKDMEAQFSKDKSKAAVSGYEKYRAFVDDGQWTAVDMAK